MKLYVKLDHDQKKVNTELRQCLEESGSEKIETKRICRQIPYYI